MHLHFCLFAFFLPGVVVGHAISDIYDNEPVSVSVPTNLEKLHDILNNIKIKKEELHKVLESSFGDDKEYLGYNMLENVLKNGKDIVEHVAWKKVFEEKPEKPTQYEYMSTQSTSYGTVLNEIKEPVRLIFPGTKWCGDGDKAKDDDHLGTLKELDKCCRAHDKCPSNIVSGAMLRNLKNEGKFTKSACICDFEFYDCLKKTNSIISWNVGKMYFNMVGPQCFQCIEPANDCNINKDRLKCLQSCHKYEWVKNRKY